MSKSVSVISVLLMLSVAFNMRMFVAGEQDMDDMNGFGVVNYRLANRLLFDDLEENNITVYGGGEGKDREFVFGEHTVRIISLGTDGEQGTLGSTHFLSHNSSCVFAFACHIFDENRRLALPLLQVLAKLGYCDKAGWVLSQIGGDGSVSADGREEVASQRRDFEARRKEYRESLTGLVSTVNGLSPGKE